MALAPVVLAGRPSASPQQPADTIGSRYRNLQVLTDLKDAPGTQLIDMMQFMSGSLSVSCNFCHASQNGPFDSDANPRKPIAREMIRMTRSINAASFAGKSVVTCNTCHQGAPLPPATPAPWHKSEEEIVAYRESARAGGAAPAAPTVAETPSVERIFERYRAAVHGDAVKSLRIVGTNTVAMTGASVPFTAEAIFPDRMMLTVTNQNVQTRTILNGNRGWRQTAQGATTDIVAGQVASTRVLLDLVMRPVKDDASLTNARSTGTALVDGVACYVVEGQTSAVTERMYFDVQSGLLKKIRRETPTPFGAKVEERMLADYRPANGTLLPRLITNHYMEDQSEFRIATVETNPPIDSTIFERAPAKHH